MKKNVYVILDIETLTDARLAFDIAWIACDSKGNILSRYNALVKEVVNTPFIMALFRRDNFMKDKSQMYIDSITSNNIDIKTLNEICNDFNALANTYNANLIMCAYNASFDYNVLNDNMNIYYGSTFFNNNIKIYDIMTMALSTICDTNKYVRWCIVNSLTTVKGNVKTNAESVYAYLTNNVSYVEEHHALADCEIEKDIFFKAKNYKKKLHAHFAMPIFHCKEWKKVQARI